MKLNLQQLESHLAKNLAPIYFIASDETLLAQEAIDAIRATARKQDYLERSTTTIETLNNAADNFSLLATRRILELNLTGVKLNVGLSKLLQEYAANPAPDTLLIVTSDKVDTKSQKSAWYQALENHGVVIQIWPVPLEQLPTWIKARAKKAGLDMTNDAANSLAQQVEGNLLAAAQEIEKLSLLEPNGQITAETIDYASADNARFDIFNLVDCALQGNSKRCLRILDGLREEDTEPPVVLWALTRELRSMAEMARLQKQGANLASLFSQFRIWDKRQPNVRAFLQRNDQEKCWEFLCQAAKIDRIIKGADSGNAWDALRNLALSMTGNAIITV